MTILKLHLFIFTVLLMSCNKEDNISPKVPTSYNIDINDDGQVDFTVKYSFADIHSPTANSAILCRIQPSQENEILFKSAAPLLFLRDLDELTIDVMQPLFWKNVETQIGRLENHHIHGWEDQWSLSTEMIHEFYYIGIKLVLPNENLYGYIKMTFDLKTGSSNIVEKKIY